MVTFVVVDESGVVVVVGEAVEGGVDTVMQCSEGGCL